jgi:N-acyl-D-amino-acid deacylase
MPMGTLLRGAAVIDGTGSGREALDVAIDGDRIVGVGSGLDTDFPEIDLSGLVLAPGFIDPHTHYDAQIFWDPSLTPSSWCGVTTVVTGNCGFTVAPTRPNHREVIIETLVNVEGMVSDTLHAGLPWSFETFPEYLGAIDGLQKRLNVACLIGHTALRWYVLGDDATDRPARPEEISRMCAIVSEAMAHGAAGFSTSLTEHVGAFGKPVPSRAADRNELFDIARAIGASGAGTIEMVIGGDFTIDDVRRMGEISGRPVTWSGRVILPTEPEDSDAASAAVEQSTRSAPGIYPQFACLPIVSQVTLLEPAPLRSASPGFLEVLATAPEGRPSLYQDPEWRRRAKEQIDPKWRRRLAAATVQETEVHSSIVNGPTLGELAAQQGSTPFDVMIDLALADNLVTRFKVATTNTVEPVVERMLGDPRCFLGLSDAGAHVTQICDAVYAPHLLGHWVRERGALPLEMAIWRLTGHPAEVYGLRDRGRIGVGYAADLVAFDPSTVGTTALERVWDFPNHGDRLVAHSTGVEYVWVNGSLIRSAGSDVGGVAPGRRLNLG